MVALPSCLGGQSYLVLVAGGRRQVSRGITASWSGPKVIKRKKLVNFEYSGGLAEESRLELYVSLFVYVNVLCPCLLDLPSAIWSIIIIS